MVRHIITWNLRDGFTEAENRENALKIKGSLEALKQYINGIVEIKVCVDLLPSSNKKIVLNSLFTDEKAYAEYIAHPKHVAAGEFVRSVTQDRACADYIE